ncbi:MAG: CotH kinase family protein [Bacteroidales bacterium]
MFRFPLLNITFFLLISLPSLAQQGFYDPTNISDIRIYFPRSDWQVQLDSIYMATDGTGRVLADVKIGDKFFKNAGVRYKGFSSWNQGERKNPFNIELDYSVNNLNYEGHTKIKLSNVIHDPSFIREVLAYQIVGKYMPAPRAGFVNLFVNDTLIGLYTNVESVDKIFISKYFTGSKNTFIKGEPEELQFPFGQNANLANTHGSDSLDYMPYYKLESDYGWSDLYHLIDILNVYPDSIEKVLNVDRTLWMHALNYTLLNLDSYIGYAQNYYLYKDNSGLFSPVIWDLNMSFGSFRSSDGSLNFQGLTIPELKTLDPLQHLNFSISPRPLMTALFRNDTWKRMYLAHMRTIMDENIRNNWYHSQGKELQDIIRDYVVRDTNKFYSNTDFENNLNITVGGTAGMILYPGLYDLMQARLIYLDSYPGFAGAPILSALEILPEIPEKGKDCHITATVSGADTVILYYRHYAEDAFNHLLMLDDGAHHDNAPGDGIYGATITPESCNLQYYLYYENDSSGRFAPERAAYEYYTLSLQPEYKELIINEINLSYDQDSWVELLNNTKEDISLKGLSLTSESSLPFLWEFPETSIPAHSFIVVSLSPVPDTLMQADMNLSSEGGNIYLFNRFSRLIDSVCYPMQVSGKSFGRYPNGYGSFVFMEPTRARNNLAGSTPATGFICYPNPASSELFIELQIKPGPFRIEIFNIQGQIIAENEFDASYTIPLSFVLKFDISKFSNGTYLVSLKNPEGLIMQKFLKY